MIDFNRGIILASPTLSDKDQFFHWRNDQNIWKWCRQNGPLSKSVHNQYWYNVENSKTDKFFSILGRRGTLGAEKDSPRLVGCCGLSSVDQANGRAEFSLYIGPEFQNQTFGVRALQSLFDYGFKWQNLNLIWGESFDGNPAMRMFFKLGMVKEGVRRQFYFRNGRYIDAHLFSIKREEWKSP